MSSPIKTPTAPTAPAADLDKLTRQLEALERTELALTASAQTAQRTLEENQRAIAQLRQQIEQEQAAQRQRELAAAEDLRSST